MLALENCCTCNFSLDINTCNGEDKRRSTIVDILSKIQGPWSIIYWQVTLSGKFLFYVYWHLRTIQPYVFLLLTFNKIYHVQDSAKTLWFGRDAFGRRSLLVHWPTVEDSRFLLSSVSPASSGFHNSGILCLLTIYVSSISVMQSVYCLLTMIFCTDIYTIFRARR